MLNLKLKNNATKALIREIEGGLPPDDPPPSGGGGGGIANPHLGDSGGKSPSGGEHRGHGSGELRSYTLIENQEDKEAFIKNLDLSTQATPIPASLDVEGFLKTLEGVKNHKNFIEHLAQKKDGQSRLAYLNLVEPTLKSPNIELVFNDPARKKYIKAFKDEKGKTLKYLLITADNNETLITGLPVRQISYLQKQIRDADIIHSFIPPGRLANEQGALTPSGLPTAEFTTPELKNQATELHAKAKEQEAGFKQLLESLSQPSSTLEASNILKSVGSIQSKLERKQGRVESLNDLLRGAIIAKDREVIDDQLAQIAIKLRDAQIPHTIEYKENRGSGYEGIHIHFKHNDVSAEIQVHTPKNWAIKKKQDESYHVTRDNEITKKLSETQVKELLQKSKALGQESDLDISLLTSFEVISTEFSGSAMSVNLKNAATDSNLTHILRLKSYSKEPPPSNDASAYKRPDSELNQNDNLFSGSGNNTTPLNQLPQNTTTPPTSPLSIHQQALQARQAREQAKLEAKRLEEQKQAQREAQEQERRTQAAKDYQQAQEQKQATAGGKQNDKNLEIGKAIAMQKLEGYSSSVSLDDARIYPLDFVIVKTSDVKPNLNAGVGTQTRTQTNPQRIEEIAKDFKPTMLFNRGGFDDLPIILSDGQVIAGNHRAKGMQSFSPQSREAYEKAVLEHYNIKLQSDELLLRTPKEGLDKQEIINLAAASNEKRLDSIGDMLVSALGKYDAYITPKNLDSILGIEHTSAADLTNRLAKALDKNSASPSVEEPSLALLANVARNTPRLNLAEALNHAQKTLDPAEFKTLKEMFSHNAPSFYLLMRDGRFPSLNLAPYLTPALQATVTALKAGERADNFTHILERLQTLLSSTHKDGTNAMVQLNPYAYEDMLSEILGAGFARFARLKGATESLYDFLKQLPNKFVEASMPRLAFEGVSAKKLADVNVYDFAKELITSTQNPTQSVMRVASLLPELEKKSAQASQALANTIEMQILQRAQSRSAGGIKEGLETETITQQEWLKAFNLESLDQPFIPKFSKEVQEALEPVLKGEQIKLTKGSLVKLAKRQREEFLPLIRPTLEEPNVILDNGRGILFIKEFIDTDKNRYFMSVAKNYDGEWVFSSHIRKDFLAIKNEFARSKVLYNKGFSGGEVAGASDILESGGTAIKPSDLQINTPPSHGSALNPISKNTKPPLKTPNIEPNPAFGENFKEFELKGAQAVAKLLQEQRGQVAGAFYREDLGYIDLVWGDSKKGLAHILERRTQQYGEQQALEFIHNLPRILQEAKFYKELENKIELITPTDMIVLGKRDNNKFVLTSFKDRRSKDRFVELENPQTRDDVGFTGKSVSEPQTKDDVLLPNQDNSSTTPLKPKKSKTPPLEIEGEHYFGHDNAHPQFKGFYGVLRLFKDKDHGEISRAFTRPDLGDIDLVWGKQKGLKGGKVVDIGLSRIHRKLKDFADFPGTFANKKEIKAANALTTIITQGIHLEEEGLNTLWLKNGPNYHGLSLALRNSERRAWIVTDHIKTQTPPQALKGYESALDLGPEWAKAFGLKYNQATFSVYLSPKVAKALIDPKKAAEAKALGVQNIVGIELSPHTLFKIEAPNKEAFLPHIRQTLEEPDLLIKNQGLLFLKEFKDPKTGKDFISLAQSGHIGWHFSQHSPQELEAFLKEQIQQGQIIYNGLKNKTPNIEPNPAFGENFKEFELKGAQAVAKLLQEQRGQVAGAFYREDLGYID
ncbi:PBECR2 nuclease fold domain-containing protein, partial [Helicobacter bizzozeronii]|uniref:putative barnase/colicin E5 family endoribonuclease n=1 Tax=Helicobacter bizzozeronii TaxID=56877 RepID=UPI0018F825FE